MVDFTSPYTATEREQLDDEQLAQSIRISMSHELDAINLYIAQMHATKDEVVKSMIHHIIEEEREHLAEFEQILFRLDQAQQEKMQEAEKEMQERKKAA